MHKLSLRTRGRIGASMGRRRRRRHLWLWPTVIGLGGAICFLTYEQTAVTVSTPPREVTPAVSRATLRLMSPFGPAFAGAMVAERAGLFEREGIRVDVRAGRDGKDPNIIGDHGRLYVRHHKR